MCNLANLFFWLTEHQQVSLNFEREKHTDQFIIKQRFTMYKYEQDIFKTKTKTHGFGGGGGRYVGGKLVL